MSLQVSLVSNFLNHHQLPFCLAMHKRLGTGFKFVATVPLKSERRAMGYREINSEYDFVIKAYGEPGAEEAAKKLALNSDVVIVGAAPDHYLKGRHLGNKISFRHSEKMFRAGLGRGDSLKRRIRMFFRHSIKSRHVYLLSVGAYTAGDYEKIGAYKKGCFKWGYFPPFIQHDLETLFAGKESEALRILWCGRLIELKHPEKILEAATYLKEKKRRFTIDVIGSGPLESTLKQKVEEQNLSGQVNFLGTMPPESVRRVMEKANIFLFTSDNNEGWGAVLNESMNSGCAVVANREIGAVPYMLKHGENGLIYDNSLNNFTSQLDRVVNDRELRERLGKRGYKTIEQTWNPEIAADNFLNLSESLLGGRKPDIPDSGPCSRASFLH